MENTEPVRPSKLKILKSLVPILVALLVIVCAGISLSSYKAPAYADKTAGATVGAFDLEDGIYEGTGTGYNGDIVVAVEIKDGSIVSIDILSSSDDEAFFNRALSVIDKIIETQQLDVDTVSGATYSSRGIINAVKNALTGEKDDGETGASKAGTAVSGSSKTIEAVEDAKEYKDGTYYGSGTGFGGTLTVKVEISGGKISSIKIVEHKDGSGYILKANAVINNIIKTQSTNVDTVSGATYSSVGIIQAVRNALSQAAVTTTSSKTSGSSGNSGSNSSTASTAGKFPYTDGIYYGTAGGYKGDITVAVVLQDKTIKAILVTDTVDDEEFFNRAMTVVDSVIKKQSTSVDTVSGATYSSKGLLNAIKNALNEAKLATNGGTSTAVKVDTSSLKAYIAQAEGLAESEYTEVSWAVLQVRLQDAKEALTSDSQDEIDLAAQRLRKALNQLDKKDSTGSKTVYVDGTYEGTAVCSPDEFEQFKAYNLSLKITVKNDKIIDITDIKGDGDSGNDIYIKRAANGAGTMAGAVTQILELGKPEGIDSVTGATCSVDAIVKACQDALEIAKN